MSFKLTFFVTGTFILSCFSMYAQSYDFTDGSIPSNWVGERSYFDISANQQLHLNAPTGTTSAAVLWPALQAENVQWEFYVGYTFAASSTNYASFYLLSTTDDLSTTTNASYYLKIGGATGSTDKIELIYQDGTTKYTVLETAAGLVGTSTVSCRIRVYRNASGAWELYTDVSGNRNFARQATGEHSSNKVFLYSGIRCIYSSTRRDKFYFDDICIQETFIMEKYLFDGNSELRLYFSDTLQRSTSIEVDVDFGMPFTATVFTDYIQLQFERELDAGNFSGTLKNIVAARGDTLFNKEIKIKKDVVFYAGKMRITEWMSDPSPSVGLPEIEWVEILNTSGSTIDMSACSISDPSSKVKLPAYVLNPDSVVILCSAGGCTLLAIKNCMEVASLPSLNNSSDSLILWANDSLLIDFIHYELTALANDNRRDGGYSIERKELPDACNFYQNIDFSSAPTGGTPGYVSNLKLKSAIEMITRMLASNKLLIETNSIVTIKAENMETPIFIQSATMKTALCGTATEVLFSEAVPEGNSIIVHIDSVKTCRNTMAYIGKELEVIYPKNIEKGDVYINEVLYNPYTGGVDFVELYNTTAAYIQLKNTHYYNAVADKSMQQVTLVGNAIMEPFGYKVLTGDSITLKHQYSNTISKNCIQVTSFLSLSDDGGYIYVTNNNADTLDQIQYGDQFQNPLNRQDEGMSLEKIVSSEKHFFNSNWTTSATKCTPGYINSQTYENKGTSENIFYCSPCHVTTNLNGITDYALLHLGQGTNGCFANVSIYKLSGEHVEDLCINQLLGSSNTFQWNGQQHGGGTLEDGIYVAVAEWWSHDGKTFTSKIAISTSQY